MNYYDSMRLGHLSVTDREKGTVFTHNHPVVVVAAITDSVHVMAQDPGHMQQRP